MKPVDDASRIALVLKRSEALAEAFATVLAMLQQGHTGSLTLHVKHGTLTHIRHEHIRHASAIHAD